MPPVSRLSRSCKMELWGSGFNGHGQLRSVDTQATNDPLAASRDPPVQRSLGPDNDVYEFRRIARGDKIYVIYAGWCQTVFLVDGHLTTLGAPLWTFGTIPASSSDGSIQGPRENEAEAYRHQKFIDSQNLDFVPASAFGTDSHGLQGFLHPVTNGLCTVNPSDPTTFLAHPTLSTSLAAVATTSAGTTSAISQPTGPTFSVTIFPNPSTLLRRDSHLSAPTTTTHHLPRTSTQLTASATAFTLLTADGNVWTWGDPRYPAPLGRSGPATTPGLVTPLTGCRITHVASGGWMGAAVSEAGEAWLWGSAAPSESGSGGNSTIRALQGEVAAIEAPPGYDGGDFSVVDIAVGEGHVLLLDAEGQVWGCGRNKEGQLGTGGGGKAFVEDWVRVDGPVREGWKAKRVFCGDLTSFVLLEKEDDEEDP